MRRAAFRPRLAFSPKGGDVVVYDPEDRRAHSLNPTAACAWRACDGEHTPEQIAASLRDEVDAAADVETVEAALDQLRGARLLEAGMSRRQAVKRIAVAGGAAAIAPAVVSVLLPSGAQAQAVSPGCGSPCCEDSDCNQAIACRFCLFPDCPNAFGHCAD